MTDSYVCALVVPWGGMERRRQDRSSDCARYDSDTLQESQASRGIVLTTNGSG